MRSLGARRFVILALVSIVGLMTFAAPAEANHPYHEYTWKGKAGQASVMGVPEPGLDITSAAVGYNGRYLRFRMKLSQASRQPPAGWAQADYVWRFKDGATQYLVQYSQFVAFGVFVADYAGTTSAGTDTTGACTTCFGTVNVVDGQALFFTTIDDFNTAVQSANAAAPGIRKGDTLKVLEADTQVDVNAVQATVPFQTDSVPAPKGATLTI
jgi:hypothetical protein